MKIINIYKHIVISKNIQQVIKFCILLFLVSCFLGFAPTALADIQSTTYSIKEYDFGSGGKLNNTSTTYSLYGNTGQVDGLRLTSTTYNALPGLTYQLTSNVPTAPTVSNEGSLDYNKLKITIATASNPSDTQFAVAISPDAFVSTTKYVQADGTLGNTPVWQTNTAWGASGFYAIGLSQNTTYSVKVSAKQGKFTQSQYGPTTTVATANPTFSYSISSTALTFPNLTAGSVATSTTTVTATVTTNGTGGATVAAYDTNAGLLSSSTSYVINSGSSDLSSISEGYGLQATGVAQSSGGPMESLSPYNGSANNVGILDTSKRNVFDSTGAPVTSGTGTFDLQAKPGNTAKAATDYADTITVIASASF